MWWDKAVCGLAHHPVSCISDKENRTQSLATLRSGGKKKKQNHHTGRKPKGWFCSQQSRGGRLEDQSWATAPTYRLHHKATSFGLPERLLCDSQLRPERKMSQQGQQRLTLPGCPGIEPHTRLAPALKGTVQFLGSHRSPPRGNCSQSSHSSRLSKPWGVCFTASQADEGCGRVKMAHHPHASSSGHQQSFSQQAGSWSESNEPGGSPTTTSLFYRRITSVS